MEYRSDADLGVGPIEIRPRLHEAADFVGGMRERPLGAQRCSSPSSAASRIPLKRELRLPPVTRYCIAR